MGCVQGAPTLFYLMLSRCVDELYSSRTHVCARSHLVFAFSFFFLQLMGLKTDLAAVRAEHAAEKQAMKNAADVKRCEREERAASLCTAWRCTPVFQYCSVASRR